MLLKSHRTCLSSAEMCAPLCVALEHRDWVQERHRISSMCKQSRCRDTCTNPGTVPPPPPPPRFQGATPASPSPNTSQNTISCGHLLAEPHVNIVPFQVLGSKGSWKRSPTRPDAALEQKARVPEMAVTNHASVCTSHNNSLGGFLRGGGRDQQHPASQVPAFGSLEWRQSASEVVLEQEAGTPEAVQQQLQQAPVTCNSSEDDHCTTMLVPCAGTMQPKRSTQQGGTARPRAKRRQGEFGW